jgi:hypothetical protein
MLYWTFGLVAVDMALMGGILYVLFNKGSSLAGSLARPEGLGHASGSTSYELISKIKKELDSAKKLAMELEKKRESFEGYERILREKKKELDGMITMARTSYLPSENPLPHKMKADDVYLKAMKMISKGSPMDEVTDMLGLLNGEAELIDSLKRFKC